jgi:hypothetical protein
MLLSVADAIADASPLEAIKLRWLASDVQWLERRVNELVAAEQDAQRVRKGRR